MSDPIRRVSFCPHCGNKAPQRLIHTQRFEERAWSSEDGSESDPVPWSSFVVVCETCDRVLVYDNIGDQLDDGEFHRGELEYPRSGKLDDAVPRDIRDVYEEAQRIKEIAPSAFAVQVRRCMEALCQDRGAHGRTLQKKLEDLAHKGEIPDVLAEASDAVREMGNVGAHGMGSGAVHPLLVNAMDELFRAVIEYVYVAPARLRDFHERTERYTKSAGKADE